MAVNYRLKRERIVKGALEICGQTAADEPVRVADYNLGLEKLELILKQLPIYRFSWPKVAGGRTLLNFPVGARSVAAPSDYYGSAVLKVMEDELADGFDRAVSTTSPGTAPTGQDWEVDTGDVVGINASGQAYLVTSGSSVPGFKKDVGFYNGEFGCTLVFSGGLYPLIFIRRTGNNGICFGPHTTGTPGTYALYTLEAGVLTVFKQYTRAGVTGDKVRLVANGTAITPYVKSTTSDTWTQLDTGYSQFNLEETIVGAGFRATTVHAIDDFFASTGNERPVEMVNRGKWDSIENHLESAEYPDYGYIDPAGLIWIAPSAKYPRRGWLSYQAVVDDTVYNTAVDMTETWDLALQYGVAQHLCLPFRVPKSERDDIERQWREMRALCIGAGVDEGPAYMEVFDG